jgi:uncharacterized repeat protein (TIGR01451 family)
VLVAMILNIVVGPLAPLAGLAPTYGVAGSTFNALDGNQADDDGAGVAETDWCTPGLAISASGDLERDDNGGDGGPSLDDSFKSSDENTPVPQIDTGSISNSTDYRQIYAAGEVINGKQYAYVSWVRWDTNGTGTMSFELNQSGVLSSNGVTYQRTQDDLLIEFNFQKSADNWVATLTYREWNGNATSGSWSNALPLGGLADASVNNLVFTDCLDIGEQLPTGAFGEFALDLSGLLGTDCAAFTSITAKSRASNEITAALDDLAGPIPVDFNTCATLKIKKFGPDGTTALGGATFSVSPNPTTGMLPAISVTDNQAPDTNAAAGIIEIDGVQPNIEYTICETDAPLGYIGASACQEVTPAALATGEVSFTNTLGSVAWTKVDASAPTTLLCGAQFSISATGGEAQQMGFQTLAVTDNCGQQGYVGRDTDADGGEFLVTGLPLGNYSLDETAAPAGYNLPTSGDPASFSITTGTPNVTGIVFTDPRKPTSLVVEKVDEQDNDIKLDGAVFELFRESGAAAGLQIDGATADISEGQCTTGLPADPFDGTGQCSISGLGFGTYYWYEVSAPDGYDLPADRASDAIVINATNAGTALAATVFEDPRKDSEIKVEKRDTTENGALLDGAKFKLWLDDGDNAFDAGDTLVTPPGEVTATGGTYTWSGLDFGTYFIQETVAPTGFDLPTPAVKGPFTINADNAGGLAFTVVFTDPRKLSSLKVIKLDEQTDATLEGASFRLWLDVDESGTLNAPDTIVAPPGEISTGADGSYTWTDLGFGDYLVEETGAPSGYDLPAETVQGPFTIDASNAGTLTHTVTFEDPQTETVVTVIKRDASDTNILLDGAEFTLWEETTGTAGLQTDGADPDTDLQDCTTVAGTCSFDAVDFGTYYVEETAAPIGYSLPAETIQGPIVIGPEEDNVPGVEVIVTFDDPRQPGTIQAEKVDADDASIKLAGAHFQLYEDDGDTAGEFDPNDSAIGAEKITDASGLVMFTDVDFGTYFVVETQAPQGYDLPEDAVCGPLTISAISLTASCTGDDAFQDPEKPAGLELDKQVAPQGTTSWTAIGLKGSSTMVDLFVDHGDSVVYRYLVENTGEQTIEDLTITDDRVTSASITCADTTLAPAEATVCTSTPQSVTAQVTNTASASATFTTAGGTSPVESNEDKVIVAPRSLTIVKSNDTTGPVAPGTSVVFTLTLDVENGPIPSVTIVDQLPTGIVVDTTKSVSGGAYDQATNRITWNLTDVQDGDTLSYTAIVSLTAAGDDYENTATITDGPCPVDCDDTSVVPVQRMSIVKTNNSASTVVPGTVVDFTLALDVENGPISSVTIVDQLPAGIGNATAISDGGSYNATTNRISWTLADVADGETLTYKAAVSATATAGTYTNVATITEGPCVGGECDDDSTVTVRVPTLVIDKSGSTDTITITGPNNALVATPSVVTWTLSYTLTNGPVTNAVITDPIPTGFAYVAGSASNGGSFNAGTNTLTWTFPTLTASGSVTFQTTVNPATISRAAPTVNTATIVSDNTAPDQGQDSVRVVVVPPPLAGNPPPLPNTAIGIGPDGTPVSVPIELLAVLFIGSLGALALANARARSHRR